MTVLTDNNYKVTRRVGKAHTLPTAPAWSFGGRHDRTPNDPGPGPGQYTQGLGDYDNKGVGFGTSSRYASRDPATPGPGAYGAPKDPGSKSKPAYTMKGVTPRDLKAKLPGPGAYNGDKADGVVRPTAPAISIAWRTEDPGSKDTKPGPQTYNADYRWRESRVPALKFRNSMPSTSGLTPGPGEYSLERKRPVSAGKTFGVSRNYRYLDNGVPGPGAYTAREYTARACPASYSIGKSPRDRLMAVYGPGPGQYVQDPVIPRQKGHDVSSEHVSAPAVTFGGKTFSSTEHATPAPGDYGAPKNPGSRTGPSFTFHGVTPKDPKANLPGPGTYNGDQADAVVRASAPAISISWRAEDPGVKDRTPGPQAYNPDYAFKESRAVSLKFRNDVPADNTGNPAPHDYADKDFRGFGQCCSSCSSKGATMGARWRADTREHVPGPQYAMGASTLGIAAAPEVIKAKMSLTVVL